MLFLVKVIVWDLQLIKLEYELAQAFNKLFNKRANKIKDQDDCYFNNWDFEFQKYEFLLFIKIDYVQPWHSRNDLAISDD